MTINSVNMLNNNYPVKRSNSIAFGDGENTAANQPAVSQPTGTPPSIESVSKDVKTAKITAIVAAVAGTASLVTSLIVMKKASNTMKETKPVMDMIKESKPFLDILKQISASNNKFKKMAVATFKDITAHIEPFMEKMNEGKFLVKNISKEIKVKKFIGDTVKSFKGMAKETFGNLDEKTQGKSKEIFNKFVEGTLNKDYIEGEVSKIIDFFKNAHAKEKIVENISGTVNSLRENFSEFCKSDSWKKAKDFINQVLSKIEKTD